MINIIGGKFKKTKLLVPLKFVRPTSAVKRNAIFSVLEIGLVTTYLPHMSVFIQTILLFSFSTSNSVNKSNK